MASGDPFRTVRTGERLRIPAAAYNAFIAAAKTHQRGRTDSGAEDAGTRLGFDTLISNQTGKNLPRFGIVCLGSPVTPPALRPAGFRARQAINGLDPSSDRRGRFAIAQEPIRAGAIGRAIASGISVVRIELLAPSSEDDDFADVKDGDSDVLLAAASGSARILWIEPLGDREDADRPWCIVRLGDQDPQRLFSVLVTVDGGSAGSGTTTCSWTYTLKTERGKVIATQKTPEAHRLPNVPYVETPEDSVGFAWYDHDSYLRLLWANEQPALESCEEGGGGGASLTFPPFSADQHDLDIEGATLVSMSADAAGRRITGFKDNAAATQYGGREFTLANIGSHAIVLMGGDAGSEEANQISLPEKWPWIAVRPGDRFRFIYDDNLTRWRLVMGYQDFLGDPAYCHTLKDDFITGSVNSSGNSGELGWQSTGNGGSLVMITGEQDRWGVRAVRSSGTNIDRVANFGGFSAAMTFRTADEFFFEVEWEGKIPVLATPSNDFYTAWGGVDYIGSTSLPLYGWGFSGFAFVYDRATSANWRCWVGSGWIGDTEQDTSPAQAVDTNWHHFRIRFDSVAGSVKFYIDGVLVGTITATLPNSSTDMWTPGFHVQRNIVGALSRDSYMDRFRCHFRRARPTTAGAAGIGAGE
ncbi:MAG: hypothetical protein KF678_15375 [Phycisphaeraceae bacterium]|nr:hypothetical protein [Phycisphaeraceae bacterium]